jgi:FlaA1/EpsC-like NDP-sugar epimerase
MRLMTLVDRLRNRTAAFCHDLLMVPVAWLAAYYLRFEFGPVPAEYLTQARSLVPVLVVVQGAVFLYFGLYRGVWRFASLPDLQRILKAVVVGVSLSALAIFVLTRMDGVPRSVPVIYAVLLPVLLGGPRLMYRWLKDHTLRMTPTTRALVVGAGRAGEMLVRDLRRDHSSGITAVGFVDDDPEKKGREVHGVRVVGNCKNIPRHVRELSVDLLIIAVPSASSRQIRRVVDHCERAGIPMRMLPRFQDLVSGRISVSELRAISIEDLLGREPVVLDWNAIGRGARGRTILVTGGGGSIGSELCHQLARLGPRALVVFEHGEYNLYTIERKLRAAFPDLELHAVLGDVCDEAAVRRAMRSFAPDVVYHAAAYKHVPMLEAQAREAARNNVIGTRIVVLAAVEARCHTFVLISTDKAVNPTNVMGASKRLGEIFCQNLNRRASGTRFITVRFGNVLDSAGSVVPLFRDQIARGGPVTVTHPAVKRYFMTIPEACQLIMQASAIGSGGEVFVLDMGEPVEIAYLARQMIMLAGKVPEEDIEIEYIGLRPGEKLFEELFHPSEALSQTPHEKIMLARFREVDWRTLEEALDALARACDSFDEDAVRQQLEALVPEYSGRAPDTESNVIPLEKVKR